MINTNFVCDKMMKDYESICFSLTMLPIQCRREFEFAPARNGEEQLPTLIKVVGVLLFPKHELR